MKRILAIAALILAVGYLAGCGGGGGRGANSTMPPTDSNPAPVIGSISPTTMAAYSYAFTLTISGANFPVGSVIVWGGRDLSTERTSQYLLTAVIPESELNTVRTVNVYVRLGNGKTSNSVTFAVAQPTSYPVPVVYSLTPTSVEAGAAAFTMSVGGSGFIPPSKIAINGVERPTTFLDRARLETQISAADISQPGTMHVTVTNPTPGGGASPSKDMWVTAPVLKVPLKARNLIYDPTRQKIYASLDSNAPAHPNTVTEIDPVTGAIGTSVSVGNDPTLMVISDDGQYLYVILQTEKAIRRITLATMTPDLKFQTTGMFGATDPSDIDVMPGSPGTVAVAGGGEVGIYDNGVQRPNAPNWTYSIRRVKFGSTPDTLYGLNSGTQVTYLTVDSNGIAVAQHVDDRFWGNRMYFQSGSLFGDTGANFDPATKRRLGRFPLPSGPNCFAPDAKNGRAYSISYAGSYGLYALTAYDSKHFVPISNVMIPNVSFTCDLISLETRGVAYINGAEVGIVSANFPQPEPLSSFGLDRIAANHLVYDRGRNKIYASVKGKIATIGNSIVTINPVNKTVESSIYVGSEPDVMELSPDGNTLYVGIDEADSIRKVDLTSGTATDMLPLQKNDSEGRVSVNNMSVMPGATDSLAISRQVEGGINSNDVSIYDGAVPRPNFVSASYYAPLMVRFPESPGTLFGMEESGAIVYSRMAVDSTGVTLNSRSILNSSISNQTKSIGYNAGRLYSSSGTVINTTTDSLVGQPRGLLFINGFFLDPPSNRMYILQYAGTENITLAYDMTSIAPLEYLEPAIKKTDVLDHDLVVLGNATIAYAQETGIIISSTVAKPMPTMNFGTTVLPSTAVGRQYDFTLFATATGNSVNWNLDPAGGSLPPGLALDYYGKISGTVGTVPSDTSYTFRASAVASGAPPAIGSRDFTILVKTGSLGSNDTCATATAISFGSMRSSLSPYGDIDVYSFDGTQGGKASVYASATASYGFGVEGVDPVIELLDSNCTRLAMNDDVNSSSLTAQISSFTLPYTGKYYVRVLDSRGDGRPDFTYQLGVTPY